MLKSELGFAKTGCAVFAKPGTCPLSLGAAPFSARSACRERLQPRTLLTCSRTHPHPTAKLRVEEPPTECLGSLHRGRRQGHLVPPTQLEQAAGRMRAHYAPRAARPAGREARAEPPSRRKG